MPVQGRYRQPPAKRSKIWAASVMVSALFTFAASCDQARKVLPENLIPVPKPVETPPPPPAPRPQQHTIFFTGDLKGYLEPCGCTSNPLGGIDRTAGYVRAAAAQTGGWAWLDAGDALFESSALKPAGKPQAAIKAKSMLDIFGVLGVRYLNLGGNEFAMGPAWLIAAQNATRTAFLSHSARVGEENFGGASLLELGPWRIGIIGVTDSEQAQFVKPTSVEKYAEVAPPPSPFAAAREAAEKYNALGAHFLIALANLPRERLADLAAAVPGLRFIIASGQDAPGFSRSVEGSTVILIPFSQGRAIGRIDLFYQPGGTHLVRHDKATERREAIEALAKRIDGYKREREFERIKGADTAAIAALGLQIEKLETRVKEMNSEKIAPPAGVHYFTTGFQLIDRTQEPDPAIQSILKNTDLEIGKLNVERFAGATPPPLKKGQPGYIGSAVCLGCHAAAFAQWQTTKHSVAWPTLETAGKQFDLSCVGCHSTGHGMPGGYVGVVPGDANKFANVQCESCHGPGSIHAAAAGKEKKFTVFRKVPEEKCLQCHNAEHSDTFNYPAYLRRALGPGHGEVLWQSLAPASLAPQASPPPETTTP